MYKPVRDGIEKNNGSVIYLEEAPPQHLRDLVHCFWELKTQSPLPEDFRYHVLPDACVNLLFDQRDPVVTAVTALQTEHRVLNLGKAFHYVGVQLLPGVWKGQPEEIKDDLVDQPYSGVLSLVAMNHQLIRHESFNDKRDKLIRFVEDFVEQKLIVPNPLILNILKNIETIESVAEMAESAQLSPRQLQRKLKESVWLSPHDFLKILRVQ